MRQRSGRGRGLDRHSVSPRQILNIGGHQHLSEEKKWYSYQLKAQVNAWTQEL